MKALSKKIKLGLTKLVEHFFGNPFDELEFLFNSNEYAVHNINSTLQKNRNGLYLVK